MDIFNKRVVAKQGSPAKEDDAGVEQPSGDAALSTFDLTTKLLKQNPEYYTVWNHRRRLLLISFSTLCQDEKASTLHADLGFLMPLLLKFPKCYWIWNHRLWLLQQATTLLPAGDARALWSNELSLVGKMLARDGRNFHGWGYRRTVVAALECEGLAAEADGKEGTKQQSRAEPEFEYTTKMIHANLSNFSAWHNRSKLIPRVLTERGADAAARKAILDEGSSPLSDSITIDATWLTRRPELTLIQEALYTDPYDQSIWFYYNYLMTAFSNSPARSSVSIAPNLSATDRAAYLDAQVNMVRELLEDAKDCKLLYQALIEMAMTQRGETGRWPDKVTPEDVRTWMDELEKLDTLRKSRWKDMREDMNALLAVAETN